MQNDVIRKLDLVVGKVEKLDRGKSNETPNSGLNTPVTNPKEKTKLPLLHQSIPATYNFMVPDSFCLSWSSFDRRTRMGAYHIQIRENYFPPKHRIGVPDTKLAIPIAFLCNKIRQNHVPSSESENRRDGKEAVLKSVSVGDCKQTIIYSSDYTISLGKERNLFGAASVEGKSCEVVRILIDIHGLFLFKTIVVHRSLKIRVTIESELRNLLDVEDLLQQRICV
ncbi:unnamed protein product [Lactuca saligna]|uniref:Uncharacterized protein n=1 Tax=Lactuca saligna TaxID=75948 RepID=A0AA35ZKP2_LACSI|nr:unnamed protein product [Lactuca saligna]